MNIPETKAKHLALAERLRSRILSGELSPGERLPSLTEMRQKYGLSRPTVERAHAQLMMEGLIVREPGRGVFVSRGEKVRSMTALIGIAGVLDTGELSPHNALFISGVQEAAARAGWEIMLLNRTSPIQWEKIDGVLNQEACAESILPRLPLGIPFVSTLTPFRGLNNVIADEKDGIRAAIEYLFALGHRRIAYLITPPESPDLYRLRTRLRSYHDTLIARAIKAETAWVHPLDSIDPPTRTYRDSGRLSMQWWLKGGWKALGCTALLVQNDESAIGAIEALNDAGVSVPHEVSVVGFDGAGPGDYFRPNLTTVVVPLREIGVHAVELLVKQMQQETASTPMTLTLPTHLKIGESTARARDKRT